MRKLNFKPLLKSLVMASFIAVCFYFIDQGIDSTQQFDDVAPGYSSILSWAKWMIIGGLLLTGVIQGLKR